MYKEFKRDEQTFAEWLQDEATSFRLDTINRIKQEQYAHRIAGTANCIDDLIEAGIDVNEHTIASAILEHKLPQSFDYKTHMAYNHVRESFVGKIWFTEKFCFASMQRHYAGNEYYTTEYLIGADENGEPIMKINTNTTFVKYGVADKAHALAKHVVIAENLTPENAIEIATLLETFPDSVFYGNPNNGRGCIFRVFEVIPLEVVNEFIQKAITTLRSTVTPKDFFTTKF